MERQAWWTDNPRLRMLFSVAGTAGIRGMSSPFIAPRVLFGADGLKALAGAAPNLSRSKKAMIITDTGVRSLAERVRQALQAAGCEAEIWDGVIPEPTVENVLEGGGRARELGPDLFVAVGGGSVMDAAKGVWLNYARPDLDIRQVKPIDPVTFAPVHIGLRARALMVCIPTTAGTGSECSSSAIISDCGQKMPLKHSELVPDLAILDPAFTTGLPPKLTAYTGMDVLAHATGSVLTHWANDYTLPLGYQAVKLAVKYLPRAVADGSDHEARLRMLVASNLAGLSFGNAAVNIDHAMGHAFGKVFGVHHGCAVGLFIPCMIQFVSRHSDLYLDLAAQMGIGGAGGREALDNLVDFYKTFIRSVGCPATILELGITRERLEAEFERLLDLTMDDGTTQLSIRPVTRDQYRRLYMCALTGERVDF